MFTITVNLQLIVGAETKDFKVYKFILNGYISHA